MKHMHLPVKLLGVAGALLASSLGVRRAHADTRGGSVVARAPGE